jgi:hypothetical protein
MAMDTTSYMVSIAIAGLMSLFQEGVETLEILLSMSLEVQYGH